ncbi:hypothetical protein ACFU8W_28455 [Streptomyces sp. NPDC057565]|uniref:hypothetical protein n=1 Tax=Streptomyces sp. NPDC057565 TaxID=3346169 RepID=UPI0036928ABD
MAAGCVFEPLDGHLGDQLASLVLSDGIAGGIDCRSELVLALQGLIDRADRGLGDVQFMPPDELGPVAEALGEADRVIEDGRGPDCGERLPVPCCQAFQLADEWGARSPLVEGYQVCRSLPCFALAALARKYPAGTEQWPDGRQRPAGVVCQLVDAVLGIRRARRKSVTACQGDHQIDIGRRDQQYAPCGGGAGPERSHSAEELPGRIFRRCLDGLTFLDDSRREFAPPADFLHHTTKVLTFFSLHCPRRLA